jgi:hypothetical protein
VTSTFWVMGAVVAAALLLILVRAGVRGILIVLLRKLAVIINAGQDVVDGHGPMEDLADGATERYLTCLEYRGGRLYRRCVPLATFLMWWPVGPRLRHNKDRVIAATASFGGLEEDSPCRADVWLHLCRGWAYFARANCSVDLLRGMCAALAIGALPDHSHEVTNELISLR